MTPPTAAERLLLSLGISRPKDIDLEAIAASQGAFVKYKRLDKSEAMIVGGSKNAVITVNACCRPERQRFSLAHELGHWHYDRGKVLICSPADIGNPRTQIVNPERRADDFASDLILPSFMVKSMLGGMKSLNLSAARAIAEEFEVSLTAALIKAVRENMFPSILVRHGLDGKCWSWPSRLIPGWWRVRRDLDDDTFAYGMLHRNEPEERWARRMPADAWFDFKGCDRYEVQEQSFRPTTDEVITILTVPPEGW